jgi:glycosyltransferase involved in cell wall biosynthesis
MAGMNSLQILFWGRFGNYGPDYPRNRVVIEALEGLGHRVSRFTPRLSPLGDIEASLRGLPRPDLLWVPCFRQRDLRAASRYARRRGLPLVFDPLISSFDKQVYEREKFAADSSRGHRLLRWERALFGLPDVVVADTVGHLDYFHQVLGVAPTRQVVIPVGAEEELFRYQPHHVKPPGEPLEILFFGTFIGLHGIETVLEAAGLYQGPPVRWRLLGEGPLKTRCEERVRELQTQRPELDIDFEGWRPLAELPARLAQADILLGIFGTSAKAQRVIPNKVYQGLALGRPILTAATPAFPADLRNTESAGLFWCRPGDPADLAAALTRLVARRQELPVLGAAARALYDQRYSRPVIQQAVAATLAMLHKGI